MSLSSEPVRQEDDLLRMIDEGIAALETDEEFSKTVQAIGEFCSRNEKTDPEKP